MTAVDDTEQFTRPGRQTAAPPAGSLNTAARVERGYLNCGGARNAIVGGPSQQMRVAGVGAERRIPRSRTASSCSSMLRAREAAVKVNAWTSRGVRGGAAEKARSGG